MDNVLKNIINMTTIKGYKVTNKDLKCQSYQFEIGKQHTQSGAIVLCSNGFHFCKKLSLCFSYYPFNKENRVFEVEASGQIDHDTDKICAETITLIRELSWQEVLETANEGIDNTGYGNTGDNNTGNSNTGDWNTGDWNTGYNNTGNRNTGNRNTGNSNTGYRNTGNRNTGNRNTGDSNTGDSNTGNRNTGYNNTGNWNTGDRNTGDWNTGNSNTGYSNTGDRNTGLFCTQTPAFHIFDAPSTWTEKEFLDSRVYQLMRNYVDTKIWVPDHAMGEEEKVAHKGWETAEGYVKNIPFKEAFQNAWHNWSEANKQHFLDLPNFNAEKFEFITGVKVKKD